MRIRNKMGGRRLFKSKQGFIFLFALALILVGLCLVTTFSTDEGDASKVKGFEIDGLGYKVTSSKKHSLELVKYDGDYSVFYIPEVVTYKSVDYTVTSIAENVCKDRTDIEGVHLSSGLEYIGERAFQNCDNMVFLTLPDTLEKIGESAFAGNESLKKVVIPPSVKKIRDYAFNGCHGLKELVIPVNLDAAGDESAIFANCFNIEMVTITAGTGHGMDYRSNYIAYDNIKFAPWYLSRDHFKTLIVEEGVLSLGNHAFHGCYKLKQVKLPSTLESIKKSAFQGCKSIQTIELPSKITAIQKSVFESCENLSQIDIHKGITSIGDYAFKNCKSLTTLAIHDGVNSIGKRAFQGCNNLEEISFGEGLSEINKEAFKGFKFCDSEGKSLSVTVENLKGCKFVGKPGKMVKQS